MMCGCVRVKLTACTIFIAILLCFARLQESFSNGKKSAIRSYLQHWFSGPQVEAVLKKLTFGSDKTEVLQMISGAQSREVH